MTDRQNQFKKCLTEFPQQVQAILQTIPLQGGRLSAQQCNELIQKLSIDLDELMTRLLLLAKIYAVVPLSRFRVGAVAKAGVRGDGDQTDLFLGANIEFMHQDLNQTIHAEQSATMHAWHQGAHYLHAVAVSDPPCGHCRQFLYEFENSADLMIIMPGKQNIAHRQTPLSDLLPEAFGPADLGNQTALMASTSADRRLKLKATITDRTIAEALLAAERSYAPYSQNFAGCALQTGAGKIYSGRNVESAAYNPSLTPLQSAIISLNMAPIGENHSIQRVVLVEKPTVVSQRKAVELLIGSWAPGIELEYFEVE
jgi:cytidine deaminase